MTPAHVSSRYHQSLRNQFICKRNSRSHRRPQTDGAFSIDTRLELLGVAVPVSPTGSVYNLQPTLKGGSSGGVPAASPMLKLVSFL